MLRLIFSVHSMYYTLMRIFDLKHFYIVINAILHSNKYAIHFEKNSLLIVDFVT